MPAADERAAFRGRLQRALGTAYVLERELGGGGMSRVFVAEETGLGRKVVVKVLSPALAGDLSVERFTREIRLAARLQHPSIVPVLSAGTADGVPYYTMPFVAGESLRSRLATGERLTLAQSVAVLRDVARALAAAHTQLVIHRDIKPDNVLLTGDGAMVADFGVAKALDAARTAGSHAPSGSVVELTLTGSALGTPAYMSPEQASGDPAIDSRSDLYAFGIMAWELLAGVHPFAERQTVQAMLSAQITQAVRPLSEVAAGTPPDLEALVMQCVSKRAEDRPETAQRIVDALAPDSGRRSDPGRWSGRMVSAAAALIVVVGATALLLRARSDSSHAPPASNAGAPTVNSPAYDAYLRGRVKVSGENRQDNEEAISYLRRAVAADPTFAPAYAELSRAYTIRMFFFAPDSEKKRLSDDAELAVAKALALNPDLAEGYFAKGLLLWTPRQRFPHEQAIAAYRRALALNPRLDEAHHQLGLVLVHVGLLDAAQSQFDSALALNPANGLVRLRYAVVHLHKGEYEIADKAFRAVPPELNPSLWASQEATVLFHLGRLDEASALLTHYLKDYPGDEGGAVTSVGAMIAARSGRRADAEAAIKRAIDIGRGFGHFHHTAYNIAVAYAIMGNSTEAVRWLEQAADDGFPSYPVYSNDRDLAALRTEPRYVALMARLRTDMPRWEGLLR